VTRCREGGGFTLARLVPTRYWPGETPRPATSHAKPPPGAAASVRVKSPRASRVTATRGADIALALTKTVRVHVLGPERGRPLGTAATHAPHVPRLRRACLRTYEGHPIASVYQRLRGQTLDRALLAWGFNADGSSATAPRRAGLKPHRSAAPRQSRSPPATGPASCTPCGDHHRPGAGLVFTPTPARHTPRPQRARPVFVSLPKGTNVRALGPASTSDGHDPQRPHHDLFSRQRAGHSASQLTRQTEATPVRLHLPEGLSAPTGHRCGWNAEGLPGHRT